VNELAAVAAAYLLGSIPFAFLAGKARGIDLRRVGSGNLGAANVFRNLGRGWGIAVMAADIGKGILAVVLAKVLTEDPWPAIAAGAAMAGHVFPVWLRFKGGKGVAVGGGALIGLVPLTAAIALGIWLVVLLTTRFSSLASIVAAVAAPLVAIALDEPWSSVAFTALGSLAILVLHRGNIARLIRHEESRIQLGRARRA
jgi:acyl phosphate:glycerol-3-phosphate acyltransferase